MVGFGKRDSSEAYWNDCKVRIWGFPWVKLNTPTPILVAWNLFFLISWFMIVIWKMQRVPRSLEFTQIIHSTLCYVALCLLWRPFVINFISCSHENVTFSSSLHLFSKDCLLSFLGNLSSFPVAPFKTTFNYKRRVFHWGI